MRFYTALDLFVSDMKRKFGMRHQKHRDSGNGSVLDEDFEGYMLSNSIVPHLREEYQELLSSYSVEDAKKECCDLANMAFLVYWKLCDANPRDIHSIMEALHKEHCRIVFAGGEYL